MSIEKKGWRQVDDSLSNSNVYKCYINYYDCWRVAFLIFLFSYVSFAYVARLFNAEPPYYAHLVFSSALKVRNKQLDTKTKS